MGTQIVFPTQIQEESVSLSRQGYPPVAAQSILTFQSLVQNRTGWNNPERFVQLQTAGFMNPSPYSAHKVTKGLTLGSSTISWGTTTPYTQTSVDHHFCICSPSAAFTDPAASLASASALGRMNANLRDQKMNLLEDLAEGPKTLKMIADGANTINKALKQLKKGNMKGVSQILGLSSVPKGARKGRSISSNWLEFRYGWMPILYESYGAVELLQKKWKGKKIIYHVHSSGMSEKVSYSKTYNTNGYSGQYDSCRIRYNIHFNSKATWKCSLSYVYEITNPTLEIATGLGLTNPLLTAWELMTLTFVVDWFLNVSDVLSQLDAWTGRRFLGGCSTMKLNEDVSRTSEFVQTSSTTYRLNSFKSARGWARNEQVLRTVLSQTPTLGLVLRPQLNMKRLLDAVSLMKQRIR